jgi:LysM repeat protein
LVVGDSYCVEENYGIPPTTTSSIKSTSTGDGVSTPTPIQTGMATNCNKFYLVKTGDGCQAIAAEYSIPLSDFYAWNPAVGATCNTLGAGDYVCVGVIGFITSTTTTTPGNGISTPHPIQTGMVTNCDAFYLVQPGDSCANIAAQYSISLPQFYSWNPAVGSSCSSLGAGDYVCVDIIGNTVTTTTKKTSTNGITTPTPIQTGMVSNCGAFYLVSSGDTCAAIVATYDISITQFYAWNPAVGSSCSSLDVGDYVCVNIIGNMVTVTSTSTHKSTPTNGISTPTPVQTGMVGNCNKFYLVQSGDSCAPIAAEYGIPLATFYSWNPAVGTTCSTLDVGDYVCVDTIGYVPPTTTTSAKPTTTTGNGITTPTPYETGMVGNCNKFYYVVSGDTCASIASKQGISVSNFEKWNPMVGSSCSGLWLNAYVCVGTK